MDAQERLVQRRNTSRKIKRRLGAAVLMSALLLNVVDNPQNNVATAAAPWLQEAYLTGKSWTQSTAETVIKSL